MKVRTGRCTTTSTLNRFVAIGLTSLHIFITSETATVEQKGKCLAACQACLPPLEIRSMT